MQAVIAIGKSVGRMALALCYPPSCPACGRPSSAEGNVCGSCMPQLRQIAAPHCQCCGAPFPYAMETDICALCLHARPPYAAARAVWVYNDISRAMIGALKYGDRSTEIARYGAQLAQAGRELLAGADVIVPIPLHWRRLMERRYNQSAWLAYALARHTGHRVDVRLLKRVRYTRPQARLSIEERRKNMREAFIVTDGARVKDKVIVLVDDVITTGTTIHEATDMLMQAGAREVRVLTLAKTLRE